MLEGAWEYQVEGKGAMRLKAGDVLFIPAGVKHGAKNAGQRQRCGARSLASRQLRYGTH